MERQEKMKNLMHIMNFTCVLKLQLKEHSTFCLGKKLKLEPRNIGLPYNCNGLIRL